MNQFDLRDSPIPGAYSSGAACHHKATNGTPGLCSQPVGKRASSRIRRAVWIHVALAGLMAAGCTSLPQASSNECVGPVSYCQLFFGS
ncbi:hypothetical protein FVF58_24250 [Paraburkholderia panacisoli]|uniref:Lipoprotein n=1 Tax=Paraburkholderia panacisoli TaxID=2603818 RepID=A0A5B0GWG5_9BURK|nr:hypothetical protein [Paraburkholderia panacisoli]KAA1007247.1 hypothetical protein FVF58_24250 [Paraburkholderia panacisoli]